MSEFKMFNAVVKEWLYRYFEKYPEKRDVIIEQLDHKEDLVDMMAHAISDIMCSVIGMFFVNNKYAISDIMCSVIGMFSVNNKYSYNLCGWDLLRKGF